MCKLASYTKVYTNCRQEEKHHVTIATVIEECDDPLKGELCPNAYLDKSIILGSVTTRDNPCPICPVRQKALV